MASYADFIKAKSQLDGGAGFAPNFVPDYAPCWGNMPCSGFSWDLGSLWLGLGTSGCSWRIDGGGIWACRSACVVEKEKPPLTCKGGVVIGLDSVAWQAGGSNPSYRRN